MSTDTNLFAYAYSDFNRVMPSRLVAEESTRQLLEISLGEHDYIVVMSEHNLRVSHL